jgi:hypothetical protein
MAWPLHAQRFFGIHPLLAQNHQRRTRITIGLTQARRPARARRSRQFLRAKRVARRRLSRRRLPRLARRSARAKLAKMSDDEPERCGRAGAWMALAQPAANIAIRDVAAPPPADLVFPGEVNTRNPARYSRTPCIGRTLGCRRNPPKTHSNWPASFSRVATSWMQEERPLEAAEALKRFERVQKT